MMRVYSPRPLRWCFAAGLCLLPAPAAARQDGQNVDCWNCHKGQDAPQLRVELSNPAPVPGETISVNIHHTSSANVAGVLFDSQGSGTLALVDPVATRLIAENPTQGTHAMPQTIVDGAALFSFMWTAPEAAGVTRFRVFSVAGNGNQLEEDDSVAHALVDVAYGCEGTLYYADSDGDGFGNDDESQLSCEPLPTMVTVGGDCNDENPSTFPGAPESCNVIDDNCDGQIDEGTTPGLYYPDSDGDGFGNGTGQSEFGCGDLPGFAPNPDDCNDGNPSINPGAPELANSIDDNCNGQVDEADALMSAPSSEGGSGETGGCHLGLQGETPPSTVHFLLLLLGPLALLRRQRRTEPELGLDSRPLGAQTNLRCR